MLLVFIMLDYLFGSDCDTFWICLDLLVMVEMTVQLPVDSYQCAFIVSHAVEVEREDTRLIKSS